MDGGGGQDFRTCLTIQINITAPAVAVTKRPISPYAARPRRPNTRPPRIDPTIPSARSISTPYPWPRMICPASQPAKMPMRTCQIRYIAQPSSLIFRSRSLVHFAHGHARGVPALEPLGVDGFHGDHRPRRHLRHDGFRFGDGQVRRAV